MPMTTSRMRFFLVRFINCGPLCWPCFKTFSKGSILPKFYIRPPAVRGIHFSKSFSLYLHCGTKSRVLFNSVIFISKPFIAGFIGLLKPLYRQNNPSGIIKRLMAITSFPSSFFNMGFLPQHSQSPTKSINYNFVSF